MQAVGDEGHEDVRLDPRFVAVEHGPDGEVVLQFLERLFDLGQLQVVAPQLRLSLPSEKYPVWGAASRPGVAGPGRGIALGFPLFETGAIDDHMHGGIHDSRPEATGAGHLGDRPPDWS